MSILSLLKHKHLAYNIVYSIFAILMCIIGGKFLAFYLPLLPSSLYGLIIFSLALHVKIFDADKVKDTVAWGIKNMGVCFVPAGVGIINHGELIKHFGIAIFLITLFTTFILLTLVGVFYQIFENRKLTKHD